MRISDWSSDVCSSDLPLFGNPIKFLHSIRVRRLSFVVAPIQFVQSGKLFPGNSPVNKVLYGLMRTFQHGSIYLIERNLGISLVKTLSLHSPCFIQISINATSLNNAPPVIIGFAVANDVKSFQNAVLHVYVFGQRIFFIITDDVIKGIPLNRTRS